MGGPQHEREDGATASTCFDQSYGSAGIASSIASPKSPLRSMAFQSIESVPSSSPVELESTALCFPFDLDFGVARAARPGVMSASNEFRKFLRPRAGFFGDGESRVTPCDALGTGVRVLSRCVPLTGRRLVLAETVSCS